MDLEFLKSKFITEYGENDKEIMIFFSPGRVNLIGEHIDYNGGFVFPAALTMGIYGIMRPRRDTIVKLRSLDAENETIVNLNSSIKYNKKEDWGNYPAGIIKYLLEAGYFLRGADVLFYSNLPRGAGLSSSAALEVLTAYMLTYGINNNVDKIGIAKLSQKVENEFIGVNCGIMDQFSVAMGKKDNAVLLNCNTLGYKYVPLVLEDKSVVIINTNKERKLSDSKYNQRREECERALEILKQYVYLDNLCNAKINDIDRYLKDDKLRRRAKHAITENERVLKAAKVLERGRLKEFGVLMVRSHRSLKRNFDVSCYELDILVEEAIKVDGCWGCRMTGAGFGGCAVAIVDNSSLAEFKVRLHEGYMEKTGLRPDFYVSDIGEGVSRID